MKSDVYKFDGYKFILTKDNKSYLAHSCEIKGNNIYVLCGRVTRVSYTELTESSQKEIDKFIENIGD